MILLLIVVGIIALLLTMALFIKREHYVNREVIISVPQQQVFNFIKLLKNQDQFTKWGTAGVENRAERLTGTDGTIGFIYNWSVNNGTVVSEKEIINIVEGKSIETAVRFIKPLRFSSNIMYETTALSENQTRVNQINTEKVKYPVNLLIPIAQKRSTKAIDESLSLLKSILEKESTPLY